MDIPSLIWEWHVDLGLAKHTDVYQVARSARLGYELLKAKYPEGFPAQAKMIMAIVQPSEGRALDG